MVKVAIITPVYYPEIGGGALASYLIVNLLAKVKDLELTVLTGVRNPTKVKGVNYYYDPLLKIINKRFIPPSLLFERYENILNKHEVVYILYAFPLIPVAKKLNKRVIVHLHDYRPISPSATVLARSDNLSSLRLLIEEFRVNLLQRKGFTNTARSIPNIAYTKLIREWVSMSDVILTASKRHAEIISKHMSECKNNIRVVYNPIPPIPSIRKKLNPTPTFLYVGGDDYIKGFHVLVKSIKQIIKRHPEVRFILAGYYGKKALKALPRDGRIEVRGKVSHEQILRFHEEAWALIFPSIAEEPCPYAVLEALMMGTLPLASSVGGVPEIIEGTYAQQFLLPPGRYDKLTDAIEVVISCKKDYLERYLVPKLLDDFRTIYRHKFSEQKILKTLLSILS